MSADCTAASTAGGVTGAPNACVFTATGPKYADATAAYAVGKNSVKGSGSCAVTAGGANPNCAAAKSSADCTTASTAGGVTGAPNACVFTNNIRTIKGFSTSGRSKMANEAWWKVWQAYHVKMGPEGTCAVTAGGVNGGCAAATANAAACTTASTAGGVTGAPNACVFTAKADNYGDNFIMQALNKKFTDEGVTQDVSDAMAIELVKKGTAYINVFMYVIHELEDAITDCKKATIADNVDAVHAWDEGWAFYAGSQQTVDYTTATSGFFPYALADKRCINYGTCTSAGTGGLSAKMTTGISSVNKELLKQFSQGRDSLRRGYCGDASAALTKIRLQMTVPLIQGAMRYAYKTDPVVVAAAAGTKSDKEIGEAVVFAEAVLPVIDLADPTAATLIRKNLGLAAYAAPVPDGYKAVVMAFQGAFKKLGITCASVGGLLKSDGTYYDGHSPCSDAAPVKKLVGCGTAAAPKKYTTEPKCGVKGATNAYTTPCSCHIAGYLTGSDVTAHSMIDLDQKDLQTALAVKPTPDYAGATAAYTVGGNSMKGSGAIRTIKGFSIGAPGKMGNWATFKTFMGYYKEAGLYADNFVTAALDKKTPWRSPSYTVSDTMVVELVKKGTAYMNVWMYVIHELEDAVADCVKGSLNDNQDGVHAWDEGWAFYAGSQQVMDGGSGYLVYALADKRCTNYGTCTKAGTGALATKMTTGTSMVNKALLEQFSMGRDALGEGKCADGRTALDMIIKHMSIPLIQGAMRYAYKTDPVVVAAAGGAKSDKEIGEAVVFTAAILPVIAAADATAAEIIKKNLGIGAYAAPVPDGYKAVVKAFQGVYPKLGLKCADFGGLLKSDGTYYPGHEQCTDPKAPTTTTGTTTGTLPADPTKKTAGASTVGISLAAVFGLVAVTLAM